MILKRNKHCECGCGKRAKPGNRFITGHNAKLNSPLRDPVIYKKTQELRNIRSKQGIKNISILCQCGCEEYTKIGRKFINGHNTRISPRGFVKGHKPSEDSIEKRRKSVLGQKRNSNTRKLMSIHCSWRRPEVKEKIRIIRNKPENIEKLRNRMLGKKNPSKRPEVRAKLSELKSGKNHHFWGKKHTSKTKKMIRKTLEKSKEIRSKKSKELWASPKRRTKQSQLAKERFGSAKFIKKWIKSTQVKPNKSEKKLNNILQKLLPKEYKLNVKANVMTLGRKIPDFVNINGKKKLIELWGDYWHRGQDPNDRINYFKQFGWNTLVVWEKELKKENLLKVRLLNFHNLGVDSKLKRINT